MKNSACVLHMLNRAMVHILLATPCTKSGVNERSISARVGPGLIQKCIFGNWSDTSQGKLCKEKTSSSHAVLDKHEVEWSYCYSAIFTAARMLGNKDSFMEVNRVGLSARHRHLQSCRSLHAPPKDCLH